MNIVTPKECRAAKRVVMKALSAINARERELHWTAELQNLESKYRPLTISARIDAAKAKVLEELSEFEVLKHDATKCPVPYEPWDGEYHRYDDGSIWPLVPRMDPNQPPHRKQAMYRRAVNRYGALTIADQRRFAAGLMKWHEANPK